MAEHFGTSRATMFRWLSDLRALNLLNKKTGLHGERGAAIRSLNVDTFVGQMLAIKAAFLGVSKSGAEVSNSEEQESQTQEQESQSREQESQSREQESHHGETQPPSLPPNIPPPPPPEFENGGGGSSLSQEQATIDARYLIEKYPKLAFGKETELAALIQEHGMPVVNAALFRCSKESFDGVRNPVAVVFSVRLPKMIAEMKADHDAVLAKKKTQERIDARYSKNRSKNLMTKGARNTYSFRKRKQRLKSNEKLLKAAGSWRHSLATVTLG